MRDLDLIIDLLGFGLLLWLSAAAVVRWISRGRVEPCSVDSLLPKGFPTWMRWVLALTFVITPQPPETNPEHPAGLVITPLGWLCFGCLALWLAGRAI